MWLEGICITDFRGINLPDKDHGSNLYMWETFKHSQVTSTYVARKYLDDFNNNPNWAISGVKHQVMQDVSVDLSINQVMQRVHTR